MPPIIEDHPHPSPQIIALLQNHLPHSLPILRRLQFTTFPGGSTPDAHILYAHSPNPDPSDDDNTAPAHFAVAYVDISKGPETEAWLYSSVEDGFSSASVLDRDTCYEQVLVILKRMQVIEGAQPARYADRMGKVLIGSFHDGVIDLLLERGLRESYRIPHDLWLLRMEDLPLPAREVLGEGMRWDVVRREDAALIQSRTHLPKAETTLMLLPSTVVRLRDDTPIAWAFLGVDGTLSTLHVEEPYRGRGIAKAAACKVIRDHNGEFGDDGWCCADVHVHNVQSQGVCKSIGGKKAWMVSWVVLDFDSLGDAS